MNIYSYAIRTLLALSTMLLLLGCTEDRYFEENKDFPSRVWPMEESINFSVTIDSIKPAYTVIGNLRNTIDYPYRNIYIQYQLKKGNDILDKQLIQYQLFDGKTGKPFGKDQSGVYSHQIILSDSVYFPSKGAYTITLDQYMREKELEGVISTGIRLNQY